ncbi:MAG: glycosyltransferase family 4 protein [Anaerolineae bacterium]|nr:glycosyltransferase family 4 protein [Anaerolineae bacterium]
MINSTPDIRNNVPPDANVGQGNEARSGLSDEAIRLLGLYEAKMTVKDGKLSGKLGEMYNALGRRFKLVSAESVSLNSMPKYMNLARNFRLNRAIWRSASSLNPTAFHLRSAQAEHKLQQWAGQFDVIVQLHTLQSPGDLAKRRPFVLVTDNTFMNSLNYWPEWVPLTDKMQQAWLELESEVYRSASYVFTWSEFTRQSFIRDYHIPADRVVAVGGGANLIAGDISSKRYDTQIAVFVGYEFERKGGFYILESWKQVHQHLPDAKLYIIGPYEPLAEPIPGVHWLGRIYDRNVLRQRLEESSVFVMPSLFEPYGHAFTEAMGMGLPVIAANHCAMPEIIHHNESGLLVPPREVDALADALIELLSNPERAQAMGHRAHHDTLHAGTWDDVVSRMAPYIRQVVKSN